MVTIRRICSLCEEDPEDQSETGLGTEENCRSLILILTHTFTPSHTLSLRRCFHALSLEVT